MIALRFEFERFCAVDGSPLFLGLALFLGFLTNLTFDFSLLRGNLSFLLLLSDISQLLFAPLITRLLLLFIIVFGLGVGLLVSACVSSLRLLLLPQRLLNG